MSNENIQRLKEALPPIQEAIPNLEKVSTTEYAGPCFLCGGDDRLRVFPGKGTFWCRQCQEKGDVLTYTLNATGQSIPELLTEHGIQQEREGGLKGSKKKTTKAQFLWSKSKENHPATIQYLEQRRALKGIELSSAFRYNSFQAKDQSEPFNRIVCRMSKPGDDPTNIQAVHSIVLDTTTEDIPFKIKTLASKGPGSHKGRGVWLYDDCEMNPLIVAEGVETTLSCVLATDYNAVAALTTSGMMGIILPDETGEIYICCDQDKNYAGQQAAFALAERFEREVSGGIAWIVSPTDECFTETPQKVDFNDLLTKGDAGGVESILLRFKAKQRLSEIDWRPPEREKKANTSNNAENDSDIDDSNYPASTVKKLHQLNKEYAACLLGSKFRVIKEGYDEIRNIHKIDFLEVGSHKAFLANKKVAVYAGQDGSEIRIMPSSTVWSEWEERRTYDSVVFAPGNNVPKNAYNLFRGFTVKPKRGKWDKMKAHIYNVFCDGNAEHFYYYMAWMARIVQDPGGKRPGVAIVLRGGKGIGKGMFANFFGEIFGESFVPINSSKGFTGEFNMHLSKGIFVFLDEAMWGGDKQAEGRLKALITEPTVLFQPKGIDSMPLNSYLNIMMASNEDWVVPATIDERRFFILDIETKPYMDREYFNAIFEEMENGGVPAMMHDLLAHDYSDVDLRTAPVTKGLTRQVQESFGDVMDFWFEILSREFLLSDKLTGEPRKTNCKHNEGGTMWPSECWKDEIIFEFREIYCKGRQHSPGSRAFWRKTKEFWPDTKDAEKQRTNDDGERHRTKIMPTLDEMKTMFSEFTRIEFNDDVDIEVDDAGFSQNAPF